MPQLNPAPWLFYFLLTWLILISLTPKKILKHTSLGTPNPQSTKTFNFTWTWPWQ
uniref:ATP synthase complex subunit 8 n=1 Tax=Hylarana latouchii TaxID=156873 RepID=A0A6M4RI60_9NEOB|nr:ATP synthase FO submit 8 [Hylarana latouchii]